MKPTLTLVGLGFFMIGGLLASLGAAGIAAEIRAEWDTPETGKFARVYDPEGNPIELWEPPEGG